MREGCELVNSDRVKHLNLNYIVRKLWECRFKFGDDCSRCPDLKACVGAYDRRCGLGLSKAGLDKYALYGTKYLSKYFKELKDAEGK